MNNVIFKEQKIWRKDFDDRPAYSINLSTRLEDGSYKNAYITIRFAKSAEAPEKISNGTIADFSGFLTSTKSGQPMIMVTSLNIKDDDLPSAEGIEGVDSFEQAETEIPF